MDLRPAESQNMLSQAATEGLKILVTCEDPADPAEDDQQRHILDNHEISGFSFNVVTLPHLQHYFKKPFTYSGVDAGKLLLLLLLLSFSLSLPRLGTVPNLNSHQRTNRVYLG